MSQQFFQTIYNAKDNVFSGMLFGTLVNVGVSVIVLETAIKEGGGEGRGAVARYAQHERSRGRPRRRIHNSWSLMRCSRLTPKKPSYKLVEEIKLFCMARLGKDGVLFVGKQKRLSFLPHA